MQKWVRETFHIKSSSRTGTRTSMTRLVVLVLKKSRSVGEPTEVGRASFIHILHLWEVLPCDSAALWLCSPSSGGATATCESGLGRLLLCVQPPLNIRQSIRYIVVDPLSVPLARVKRPYVNASLIAGTENGSQAYLQWRLFYVCGGFTYKYWGRKFYLFIFLII